MLNLNIKVKNKRGLAFIIGCLIGILIIVGMICLDAFILKILINWTFTLFNIDYSIVFLQSLAIVLLLWFIGSYFKNFKK